MTSAEFAAQKRAEFPGTYDHLSDTELITNWLRKHPHHKSMISDLVHSPLQGNSLNPTVQIDHTSSNQMKGIKQVTHPFPLFVERQGDLADVDEKLAATRAAIARNQLEIERVSGEVLEQEIMNVHAPKRAGMKLMHEESQYENLVTRTKQATDAGMSIEDHSEWIKKKKELELAHFNKKQEMELEFQHKKQELELLIGYNRGRSEDAVERFAVEQLRGLLTQRHLELERTKASDLAPAVKQKVIEYIELEIASTESEYRERLKLVPRKEAEGGFRPAPDA